MKQIVVFGCPFDKLTSYRKGQRFAPKAIRENIKEIENYSPYLDGDIEDINYKDTGDLKLPDDVESAFKKIEEKAKEVVKSKKVSFAIGGDHSVTVPLVRGISKIYRNLKVIYVDAHCDFRHSYQDTKFSHASVARRVMEFVGPRSIYIFGARSGERTEFRELKKKGILNKFAPADFKKAIKEIGKKPVYITFDLDIFDPGVFPGTGVPDPGGIKFTEFTEFTKVIKGLNIVGFDMVELSPPCDKTEISTFLATTVFREMLIAISR